MHSYFPHPKDRQIILRLGGKPDPADLQAIPHLMESRIHEHGRILLMLDIQNSEGSPGHTWKRAFLNDQIKDHVERQAVVTKAGAGIPCITPATNTKSAVSRAARNSGAIRRSTRWRDLLLCVSGL